MAPNLGTRPRQSINVDCSFSGLTLELTDVLTPTIPKTVLEVLDLAGTLKGTFVFAGATSPRTITNAQLVAALGSETSFELRARLQRNGYRSLEFDTVKVTKI